MNKAAFSHAVLVILTLRIVGAEQWVTNGSQVTDSERPALMVLNCEYTEEAVPDHIPVELPERGGKFGGSRLTKTTHGFVWGLQLESVSSIILSILMLLYC